MTLPRDTANLQAKMSAAVREHWKAFLIEGILLVILGLADRKSTRLNSSHSSPSRMPSSA